MTLTQDSRDENTRRRALLTALLKIIDIGVGLLGIAAGVFALVATPSTVLQEIQLDFLVYVWGGLLIVGGFASALGRLVGIWILETTGIVGMGFGVLIYIAVIVAVLQGRGSLQVAVVICLLIIALLAMVRRYVELQIFTSEPNERGWISRLQALFRVRTVDAPLHR